MDKQTLIKKWKILQKQYVKRKARLFPRDAAALLGVSEFTLATITDEKEQVQLIGNPFEIISFLESYNLELNNQDLPKFKFIIRNQTTVLEPSGVVTKVEHLEKMISLKGKDTKSNFVIKIDPRFWTYTLLQLPSDNNKHYSLQSYDSFGNALLKIYSANASAEVLLANIGLKFKGYEQEMIFLNHSNSHFILDENDKTETKTTNLATCEVINVRSIPLVLKSIINSKTAINLVLSNQGVSANFTGIIEHYLAHGEWENIIDKEINIHIKLAEVSHGLWWYSTKDSFVLKYINQEQFPVLVISSTTQVEKESDKKSDQHSYIMQLDQELKTNFIKNVS